MPRRFEGKVAFISGIARGQGRSHAMRFAAEGADIIGIDICENISSVPYSLATEADLEQTEKDVREHGARIYTAKADTRDYDAVRASLEAGIAEFGRLDIIVANAGVSSVAGPSQDCSEQLWRDVHDVNLTGVWQTAKAGIPHLIAGGRGGSIVLTGSAAAVRGYGYMSHYVAAKHGLVGLARSLALELAPHMIRVNSVHPVNVNTEMLMNEPTFKLFCPEIEHPTVEDFAPRSQALNVLPVPWVEVADVSNAVLFLTSEESRYITGVALSVDAGAHMK